MWEQMPGTIGVYLPMGTRQAKVAGVQVKNWSLAPSQRLILHGLPVTTRTVTVLDCMGELTFSQAVVFADRAHSQGWISARDVQKRLSEQRQGNQQLRKVWHVVADGGESEAERMFIALLRHEGITGWQAGYRVMVNGRLVAKVDVAFPAVGLAIEIDGFAYHSNTERFQRDRTRQNALIALGWKVIRFTWTDLTESPEYILGLIHNILRETVH
jgi:very-short-patch-repair endonuclease